MSMNSLIENTLHIISKISYSRQGYLLQLNDYGYEVLNIWGSRPDDFIKLNNLPRASRSCVALFLASLCFASAQGVRSTEPLPTSAATSTNAPKKDPLKAIEESLTKSFGTFAPNTSLDGILSPPLTTTPAPRQAIPTRKLIELLERKKSLELKEQDLSPGAKSKEDSLYEAIFMKKDAKEKKKPTDLDEFYKQLNRRRQGKPEEDWTDVETMKKGGPKTDLGRDFDEDSEMPGAVRDTANAIRKLLDQDKDTTDPGPLGLQKPVDPATETGTSCTPD